MATLVEYVSVLHQSHTQAKTWHNSTTVYSEHKALGAYYDEIVELVDGLVESSQGVYPRFTGYTTKPLVDWVEGKSVEYFKMLYTYLQKERTTLPQETWIQNQIDSIVELVAETSYQLSLK